MQAAAKPVPLRVAALVTKPSRAALRPTPVEQPEPRHTAHASTSRQPSPKKVSPKKVARVELNFSAPPYRSVALAPLPSRPEIAPLNGRSVSHTILPTVHSSTSITENVHRSTRPILPQSYSTTALPTDSSNFVSRFATGPIRIIRPAPMIQDDGGDPDGFMYTTGYAGPSRPTQHLGHGRKPIGPARRVVTAPTPSKEVLGYPTRTPAANKILARTVRDKVEEVQGKPVLSLNNRVDPVTPIPTRKVVQETPPPIPRVESPILPVLPPDVEDEDLRNTSMLTPVNGRELESPVPVKIAALVPLPDEVDVDEGEEAATIEKDLMVEPEQVNVVLQPVVIEAMSESISAVDEAIPIPPSTVDQVMAEPISTIEEAHLPSIPLDQSTSVTATMSDETIAGPVLAVEETPLPTSMLDQSTSTTATTIDETIPEPVAVEEATVPMSSPLLSSEPITSIDETISIPVSPTADAVTHAPVSTIDESVHVKAPLIEEPPSMPLEEAQSTATPLIDEENTEPVSPDVTEDPVIEEVGLEAAPVIVLEIPASTTEDAHPIPQSPDTPAKTINLVSETEIEPLLQIEVSEKVDAEVTEDPTVAPALTQIKEDLPATSASTRIEDEVITPIPDLKVQEAAPSESEIATAIRAATSMPPPAPSPLDPAPSPKQVDPPVPKVQIQTKAPFATKNVPVTRAPSRSAQSRPTVKPVQTVKSTTAPVPAPAPPRKPPVPRAAAISRPIKPVERKTFRPVTAAQTAAAASLAKVRTAQAVAQAEAAKPRVPSATLSKPAAVEPRPRVASAASSSSHGATAASSKSSTATTTAPAPVAKTTQSRLLAPTKASASRAAPTISHPTAKITTPTIASNPALPPVRKEKIKLKAALPSFRPVRNAVRSTSGPGQGTWIASSTSKTIPRAAAIPLPHSPVSTKSVAKPETIALPPSPMTVRPETMALPPSPTSGASRPVNAVRPALQPLPASPTPVAAEVPLPDSPISQASQLRSRVTRAASPAISALQARLATPSRNSSAPTMSDQGSDSEGEDETSGVTFKVKSDGRPQSGMKLKMRVKQSGTGDLMEFSAPARMEKVWIGSTTPMYTPGRKALVIRDANLASPLVRKVVNEE
jgi:hypothetical protein